MSGTVSRRVCRRSFASGPTVTLAIVLVQVIGAALVGCATWQAPEPADDTGFRSRAASQTVGDVRLSAAVMSAADSERLFGADVNATGIQPVWIEVENPGPSTLWLLRAGTDPDYFSPLEVAWSFHAPLASRRNAAIDDHFHALDFENPIPPDSTRAGIIFTNPHHRTRLLNVDLLGQRRLIPFTLFLPDPDNPPDEDAQETVARYAAVTGQDLQDSDALRKALQKAPCCAQGKAKAPAGDPVNVVLVGELDDIAAAFVRRGFRSDRLEFDDAQRLFGRRPDFVFRKAGQGGAPAHWIRGWVASFRHRGQLVFFAQTGRPVGGRFAIADGGEPRLHPDVDEVRNLLIQDLLYSGGVAGLGFVGGVSGADDMLRKDDLPERSFVTDGYRAVLLLAARPRSISDVEILDWVPLPERREMDAAVESTNAR